MDTYTEAPRRIFIDLEANHDAGSSAESQTDADIAHSERNILRWRAYLPEDCIRAMIRMG
jgi:hypothetical protein